MGACSSSSPRWPEGGEDPSAPRANSNHPNHLPAWPSFPPPSLRSCQSLPRRPLGKQVSVTQLSASRHPEGYKHPRV